MVPTNSIGRDTYRRITAWAGVSLALIVVTGAAVRLTQSGLGCEDWPTCNDQQLVPEWGFHGWIEFGNRLLSGLVAVAVAVATLGAYRIRPRRPDLIKWSWGLVAGVATQVILGGVTVLTDLHPITVSAHFLLSMVLLFNSYVLWRRASQAPGPALALLRGSLLNHLRILTMLSVLVLITGTLVTGSGPNSGDSEAVRLAIDLRFIAQIHSVIVWTMLAAAVSLSLRLRFGANSDNGQAAVFNQIRWLLVALVAQGGIGYIQYFTGVPPAIVQLHVVGAIAVWCLTVVVHLSAFERSAAI